MAKTQSKIQSKSKVQSKNKAASKKAPAKKPAPAKKEVKPAAKKTAPVVKKAIKPAAPTKAPKAVAKKVIAKVEPKVKKAALVPPKVEAKVVKTDAKPLKTEVKPTKSDAKLKTKAKKTDKKQEEDFDDEMIGDDFGESEIAEYEDDLKAVEDDDEDLDSDLLDDEDSDVKDEEVYLTDSEGRRLCRVRDCDQVSVVEGYCRYHYLLLWKKIQIRKAILIDGKLEKYIEDLTSRYPDKFLEMLKKDMKSEKDFLGAIQELEIDESALGESDTSDDDAQSFADEIRGIGEAPAMDDDGDY